MTWLPLLSDFFTPRPLGGKGVLKTHLSYYFVWQGSLNFIGLYINRFAILDMVNSMRENFWRIEDVPYESEKMIYTQRLKQLKFKYTIYTRFLLADVGIFLVIEALFKRELNEETWPVKLYIPSYCNKYLVYGMDFLIAYVMMVSALTTDVFMFSTTALLELQFNMLHEELRRAFSNIPQMSVKGAKNLSMCNDHMDVLFG